MDSLERVEAELAARRANLQRLELEAAEERAAIALLEQTQIRGCCLLKYGVHFQWLTSCHRHIAEPSRHPSPGTARSYLGLLRCSRQGVS